MRVINYQQKIIGLSIGMVTLVALLLGYGFPWLSGKLSARLEGLLGHKKTVLELRQEQHNLELAKQDLDALGKKSISPDNFFNRDVTLVTQIRELEETADRFRLEQTLAVSGAVTAAPKATGVTDIFMVPLTLQLRGEFGGMVQYLEWLEHSGSLLSVRALTMGSSLQDTSSATLTGTFYLKK